MSLPVVVLGAGPVGLAAASHLLERGLDVVVLEKGATAGAAVAEWGHLRLFSPWKHVVDAASVRRLAPTGWTIPSPETAPTGRELVDLYLAPLAATLGDRLRLGTRVTDVARLGMDRARTDGRGDTPFVVRLADGEELRARAVLDASGTLGTPNPALASGLRPRLDVSEHLVHGLPDVLGRDRARFAGRRTVVVGAGHSAANALLALARLADEEPGTEISWVIRSASPTRVYGSDADELSDRATLGAATRALVDSGRVTLHDRLAVTDIVPTHDGVALSGLRGEEAATVGADTVVVATGFRPDLAPLRELRLALDEIVEAPARLAPLIDPNLHSCGTVPPHGVDELTHPEPGFWIVGMKSYGRAPTFLLLTGYEQVRSIADELAGRPEAARRVELVLPATGVCSTDLVGAAERPLLATIPATACCR